MKQEPLLMNELTDVQRASLASVTSHPGYKVIELMFMEACKRATEDIVKVNPEEQNATHIIAMRQLRARERNEFSLLVLKSIEWHIQAAIVPTQEAEVKQENPIVKPPQRND